MEESLEQRIIRLKDITKIPGWSYGHDKPIENETWDKALEIVNTTKESNIFPEPFISPCGDGSVHIYWTWKTNITRRFIMEVFPNEVDWASQYFDMSIYSDEDNQREDAIDALYSFEINTMENMRI